ncbi:MAG: hypothetical protein P8Z37_00070 [Acidobacteriota bacterium]
MRQSGWIGFCILVAVVLIRPAVLTASGLYESSEPEQPFVILPPASSMFPERYGNIDTPLEHERSPFFKSLSPPPDPMTGSEKLNYYAHSTYGFSSFLRSAASAGIKQGTDSIPEWGQGIEGYSARFASSFGRRIIKNSIHQGMGGLLHEDPRYFRSGRSGIWSRSLYAASQTFVSHKDSGETCFAYAHVFGTVSSVFISHTWYPENKRTVEGYASYIATSFGFDAVINIAREFWPDIKRYIFK